MPELPEVETVARGLRQAILGRRILSVTLGKTDFIDDPAALEQHLPGRQIEAVERYGKFMLLRLSALSGENRVATNGDAAPASLLVHLGMTGQIAPRPAGQPLEKHTHVCLLLDDGRELRYTDARRFGRIAYLTKELLAEELTGFGADPLEVSKEEFANRICGRRARIKALLLDQGVLRGVGNIYADESLWKAKIHPAQLGANLSLKQIHTLRRVLQDILRKAIVLRGSSISDFLDAEGKPGEYQRHHRVYGREGKNCYRCKTLIRRAIVAGRSSYFCPRCQPSPRDFIALPLAGRNERKSKHRNARHAEKPQRRNGKSR
ncbi:MAG TPA: bifunctional DNA-formamidopyrimidine glycosylase/DNA-(apurinic or apyrimidinic site) lyase [Candidatus Limnocylindria bacterium]|jgi:formamidopyrimidine-DNA glycosylase|nr:bifunctional DNA-formamidopyrimidine glycosylase/DNA-(apurinic or apyrimidinic site) lyase [Candidatus Limnocylindria bacterium]